MKKRLAVLIVCVLALFMVGCQGVSVSVLAYRQGGLNYRQVNIVLPQSVYSRLNTEHDLERYFTDLCAVTDCGFEFDSIGSGEGHKIVMLVKAYDPDEETDDFTSSLTAEADRGFFFTDVRVTGKNPYDTLRLCETGEVDETYNDVAKIFFAINNGLGTLKPIYEYYPTLRGCNLDELELNFFYEGKRLMTDSNADSKDTADFKQFYNWSTTYGQVLMAEAKDIEFSYKAASSVGWYVLALVAGIAVVAVLLIVHRRSKESGKEAVIMTPAEMYYYMAMKKAAEKEKVFAEKGSVFEEFSDFDKNNDSVFEGFDNDKDR